MYYPKSKIISNLYTKGGELVIQSDNSIYKGYYHKLYNGKIYSGKTPEDSPIIELVVISNNQVQTDDTDVDYSQNNLIYNYLKDVDTDKKLLIPANYIVKPTEDEYKLGEVQRYFLKKINEKLIFEIDKEDFDAIKGKDEKYLFKLFFPFELAWQIGGNRIDVININKKSIHLLEISNKFPIKYYFKKFDFCYKYPIWNTLIQTLGNELKLENDNFIGYYLLTENGFISKDGYPLEPLNEITESKLLNNILTLQGKNNILLKEYNRIKNLS